MATTVERLAEQAMKLSGKSRARLADILVDSVIADESADVERAWVVEAKRRLDEIRSGRVKTIPGDEVRRRIRRILDR